MLAGLDEPVGLGEGLTFDEAALHARHPALASFARRLGNTPLVEVPGPPGGASILAKCEWQNPAGSIKDRVAYAMVCDALARHDPGAGPLRLLEYSGGNLAAALSLLARDLALPLHVVLSSASPASLLDLLAERGTAVTLVQKERGFLAVIDRALELARIEPGWTVLFQHRNAVNVAYHRATTGAEIARALGGRAPAAWVASIGTGGTLVGVMHALRERLPGLRTIGVTPRELPYASSEPPNGRPKYAGSGGLGYGIRQPFVAAADAEIAEQRTVSYDDALAAMGTYYDRTGTRIGSSSGANWLVACEIAAALPPAETVLTVFPCPGTPEEWKRLGR